MKRLALTLALAALATGHAAVAGAQSSPPALPSMTAEQSADVQRQLDVYRSEINGRVSRGEITERQLDAALDVLAMARATQPRESTRPSAR